MGGRDEAKEELRSVGSWASVGHGEDTSLSVTDGEVLVFELATVDGLAAAAITSGEIATLSHEAGDDSVEARVQEVEVLSLGAHALLSSAESAEVLGGLGSVSGIEGDSDSAGGLASNGDIKVNLGHLVEMCLENKFDYKLNPHILSQSLNQYLSLSRGFGVLGFWGFGQFF